MSDLTFIIHSLRARWLNCMLSIFLTAFGISIAFLMIQFGDHIKERLKKDGQGIDIVVGAKGSPLQLILSTIYHFDVPTGNIPYSSAKELIKNPQIKNAIPLALGDNWRGHRIVGTTTDYITHYNAQINEGDLWLKDFEVVVGASVNLNLNQEIIGSHGLLDDESTHESHKYIVKGILKPSGTVLDRLILTSLDSVLKIHGLNTVDHDTQDHDKESNNGLNHEKKNHNEDDSSHIKSDHKKHNHVEEDERNDEHHHEPHIGDSNGYESKNSEITALLITTNSPVANINLPRIINRNTLFLAANPAVEMTRFTSMLGLGSKSFAVLSFILIIIASMSIFSGLAANLENRMRDLAILRAIGYSKKRIFKIICSEGLFLIISGIVLGFLLGIFLFNLFVQLVAPLNITQASLSLSPNIIFLTLSVLLSGFIASLIPAMRASKISVAKQLSRDI